MGTRSGDLDPGLLVYLLREKQFDAARLAALIDQGSGLLGISGVSGDMRRLHDAAASNPDARLAIEMFCSSVRKQVAAMAAVLGGLDMLVFTGGIGENDALVRAEVCRGLSWMGVGLDAQRTARRTAPSATVHRAARCRCMCRCMCRCRCCHRRKTRRSPAMPGPCSHDRDRDRNCGHGREQSRAQVNDLRLGRPPSQSVGAARSR